MAYGVSASLDIRPIADCPHSTRCHMPSVFIDLCSRYAACPVPDQIAARQQRPKPDLRLQS